ncbi:hypothetical protein pdul_cds_926 [Pandoravirus dulcis]|uniref:Uncharacterized protein n=1 Tax=Pandoravirus dulcis TaxID=1349409 RepID=S4VUT2_9VIRU|nr:hypothetical protein pdul_cds_926 [Pandoravirus dulcis]AGO83170.1 hypothetical protein pdul_cds_926 [Pandoravirus dulcis]
MQAPSGSAPTAPALQEQRRRQQQAALQFVSVFAQTLAQGTEDAIDRAERLCASAPALCGIAWPALANAFPEAAGLLLGLASSSSSSGAPPRALSPRQVLVWARWREAHRLFDAGQFDLLEQFCVSSPGRRRMCDTGGLGWVRDYVAAFDSAAEPFFGPGGLDDTLTQLLLWRRQQADRRRRALYGLGVAYDEWLAQAEDRGGVADGHAEPASAVAMAGAPENDLQLRLRGLLGTSRVVDVVPLGASAPPPERVSPIPVMNAPIDRWTPEAVASGAAFAGVVPGGVDAVIGAVSDAIADAELRGLDLAVDAALRRQRRVRADASVGAATGQQVAEADQAVAERVAERDEAVAAAAEPGGSADIGTAFPGTGVYLMNVFVGDALIPALGVIPAASLALPPPDCPQCIERMAMGLPPIIGRHPRH